MKLHVWLQELQPLTDALVTLLTVLTVYYIVKLVDMAAHIFLVIRNYYATREEMRAFTEKLADTLDRPKQD